MKFKKKLAMLLPSLIICFISVKKTVAADFQGLGDLQGGEFRSVARDISADGSVVVGGSFSATGFETFIWDAQNGMRVIQKPEFSDSFTFIDSITRLSRNGLTVARYSSSPQQRQLLIWDQKNGIRELNQLPQEKLIIKDVSYDASVVVGYKRIPKKKTEGIIGRTKAMIWVNGSGIRFLDQPKNADYDVETVSSKAMCVSTDGSTVAGFIQDRFKKKAFIWNKATGMQEIGDLDGGRIDSLAWDISADGSTVVGKSASSNSFNEAFIWNKNTGMQGLGDLPGGVFESYAHAVSVDGSVVVGQSTSGIFMEVFIWDKQNGMRSLKSVLTEEYNLNLKGWHLSRVDGISDDGSIIVGTGWNPDGNIEAWIVRLK